MDYFIVVTNEGVLLAYPYVPTYEEAINREHRVDRRLGLIFSVDSNRGFTVESAVESVLCSTYVIFYARICTRKKMIDTSLINTL